jgi:hypothetical protein
VLRSTSHAPLVSSGFGLPPVGGLHKQKSYRPGGGGKAYEEIQTLVCHSAAGSALREGGGWGTPAGRYAGRQRGAPGVREANWGSRPPSCWWAPRVISASSNAPALRGVRALAAPREPPGVAAAMLEAVWHASHGAPYAAATCGGPRRNCLLHFFCTLRYLITGIFSY